MTSHHLEMKFDKESETISWVVDGLQRFRMKSSEMLLDEYKVLQWGPNVLFKFPSAVNLGIGTLSALNYYKPVEQIADIALVDLQAPMPFTDPRTGEPAQYVTESAEKEYHAWGQGANFYVQDIIVEQQSI
jgi:hypothetical protein